MLSWLPWSLLACSPGSIVFPGGEAPIRSAHYRAELDDGDPVLRVFLSSSELPCTFPEGDDAAREQALVELQLATCRESARHVGLTLYRRNQSGSWSARYPARAGANPAALSDELPRLASGAYVGIEEAFLVQVDGLDRWYASAEETYLPDLGAGWVEVEEGAQLSGRFSFDGAGVYGAFAADACDTYDGLLELLVDDPMLLCP
jgi:hypothetical protein